MKLPQLNDAPRYAGFYVVDFEDHCGVGFTAEEVAELLDSEAYAGVRVYRIHNAYPDGRMELVGIRRETFQLEMGMFFYASDPETARGDYERLVELAEAALPPSRAKVHLARCADGIHVTALIYPAEYNDQFSRWLIDGNYATNGPAEGGIEAVARYYRQAAQVLERRQLMGESAARSLTGEALQAAARRAVVR